jgi:hypothetical protein
MIPATEIEKHFCNLNNNILLDKDFIYDYVLMNKNINLYDIEDSNLARIYKQDYGMLKILLNKENYIEHKKIIEALDFNYNDNDFMQQLVVDNFSVFMDLDIYNRAVFLEAMIYSIDKITTDNNNFILFNDYGILYIDCDNIYIENNGVSIELSDEIKEKIKDNILFVLEETFNYKIDKKLDVYNNIKNNLSLTINNDKQELDER